MFPYFGYVVNKAAMNIRVHVSFQISVFLFLFSNIYPEVKLLSIHVY